MTTSGEKPGKGRNQCIKCRTIVTLDNHEDTLPPCPNCKGTDFRKL